jgi:hypothetical protein
MRFSYLICYDICDDMRLGARGGSGRIERGTLAGGKGVEWRELAARRIVRE